MHIIVIAWLYVTVLMALTETSVVAGVLSLVFYGLLPVALLLWLFGGPARRRRAARRPEPANPGPAAQTTKCVRPTLTNPPTTRSARPCAR
jgi:hypothetical protein